MHGWRASSVGSWLVAYLRVPSAIGLPPSAYVSTNNSASTNIISGEDGTHASAVVSTNVTGSTDVIFGEIVALHVVPIVYLILVTQARSTQLP